MKKKTAGKTSMKKRLLIPIAVAAGMMMTVPAFAQHIYIGDTETVISYDENGNKVITLIFDPAKTPDYMKPDSPNYWRKAEQAQMEQNTGIASFPQAGQATGFAAQPEEIPFQPIPPLTEAPEVGAVLANIQQEDENGIMQFTEAYRGADGQCTWYAAGRFQEIHGIALPLFGNAKEWIANAWYSDDVRAVTDLSDVPEQAVAVYRPTERFRDWPGHVSFVEYVERDENGKPLTVYYTDANGVGDPEKDAYSPGYDGSVKAVSYEYFLHPYGVELIGYLVPKDK